MDESKSNILWAEVHRKLFQNCDSNHRATSAHQHTIAHTEKIWDDAELQSAAIREDAVVSLLFIYKAKPHFTASFTNSGSLQAIKLCLCILAHLTSSFLMDEQQSAEPRVSKLSSSNNQEMKLPPLFALSLIYQLFKYWKGALTLGFHWTREGATTLRKRYKSPPMNLTPVTKPTGLNWGCSCALCVPGWFDHIQTCRTNGGRASSAITGRRHETIKKKIREVFSKESPFIY